MAPGGVLDASSRLVQTLMEVPAQREMFRKGLEEKTALRQREDERIGKTDRIGYLKDRIATVQKRIHDLRNALGTGDTNEARVLAASLRKSGGVGLSGDAAKAVEAGLKSVADREAEIRKQNDTKVGKGLATAQTEQQIKDEVAKFETEVFGRIKKQFPDAFTGGPAGISADALALAKKDPQLQQELDVQLQQQDELFDQYRRLVGQTEDLRTAEQFLAKQIPDFAPSGKALTADPLMGEHPDDAAPPEMPMARTAEPAGSPKDGLIAAMQALTDPVAINKYATNVGAAAYQQPQTMTRLSELALTQAPALNSAITNATQHRDERAGAGLDTMVVEDKLSQIQDKGREMMAQQLAASFGAVTPESLELARAILATVHPAGVNMGVQQAAVPPAPAPESYMYPGGGLGAGAFMQPAPVPPTFMQGTLVPRMQRVLSGGMPLAPRTPVR